VEKTFLYHALATGVSGQITQPFQHLIEVQAPTALPHTGGYSASRVEGFRFEHIISFTSASSVSTGSESANSYNTLATATIEGLNILNVVTADRVVARLASFCTKDKGARTTTFAGSHIVNLRIGGFPVEVILDPARLKTAQRTERAQFGTFAAPPNVKGLFGLELSDDGAIHIPEFGKIYFAESVITACYQTISMLRIVLGCAIKGHLLLGVASTDGEPMPG
jgi:hypothetical protein